MKSTKQKRIEQLEAENLRLRRELDTVIDGNYIARNAVIARHRFNKATENLAWTGRYHFNVVMS